jgi:hypothetical protein
MNDQTKELIKRIKELPKGRLLNLEHFPVPDDYRGVKTDHLKELIDEKERTESVQDRGDGDRRVRGCSE